MKVYNKVVYDMTDDGMVLLYEDASDYDGDVAQCGSSGSSSGSYKISNEEKAILSTLNSNMQYMTSLYKKEQLPYDLMVLEGNKELYPDYFSYNKSQLDDAQTDLNLNRTVKDAAANNSLNALNRQDALGKTEFDSATERNKLYDATESKLAGERLGMLSADVNGAMGTATSDVAQAYGQQRDALSRDQARLGIAPGSGAATEQQRLTGLDFAKTNALARTGARNAETDRVENANLGRVNANWGKDSALLNGGRSTMTTAKDYTAMLNGGFGVVNGYQSNTGTPSGTDFNASMTQTSNSAANGPSGTYVPGSSSNGMWGAALGAAGTIGGAMLMGG